MSMISYRANQATDLYLLQDLRQSQPTSCIRYGSCCFENIISKDVIPLSIGPHLFNISNNEQNGRQDMECRTSTCKHMYEKIIILYIRGMGEYWASQETFVQITPRKAIPFCHLLNKFKFD